MFRPAAVFAAVLALAGCASLAPKYERPAAPVPAQLPVPATDAASAPAEAALPPWQDFVQSAPLRELLQRALVNNRDLRVAALNVERSRALLSASEADRWPTVGAGLTAARQPSTTTANKQVNLYTAGLQVNAWELDLFGRIASLNEAARAQLMASEAGRRGAELSVVAAVVATALTLAADNELLALAERTLATRRESARLTGLRFDNGAASALDQNTAQSLLAQARTLLVQQRRVRSQDLNALALLVGQPAESLGTLPLLVGPATQPTAWLADVPVGVNSQVLLGRPDVLQAEGALMAANANIGAARAAFFPRVSLTTSVGLASTDFASLFEAGSFAWTVAASAIAPIFDAGRNRANLAASKTSRDIAVAQYERAVQNAFRETADALAGLGTWREQLAGQRDQLSAAREIARLTELRFDNGAASLLERLDAERNRFAAEQAVVSVQLAELQNRVALYKALGR
ncbi:MAG: efflux transporter outer membrane subunit [Burkholderiales bacterium]